MESKAFLDLIIRWSPVQVQEGPKSKKPPSYDGGFFVPGLPGLETQTAPTSGRKRGQGWPRQQFEETRGRMPRVGGQVQEGPE